METRSRCILVHGLWSRLVAVHINSELFPENRADDTLAHIEKESSEELGETSRKRTAELTRARAC